MSDSLSILTKLASRFGESAIAGAVLGAAGGIIRAIYAKNADAKSRILMLIGGAVAGSVAFIASQGAGWSEGTSVGVAVGVALAARELSELVPRLVRNNGDSMAMGIFNKFTGVSTERKPSKPAATRTKKPAVKTNVRPAKKTPVKRKVTK